MVWVHLLFFLFIFVFDSMQSDGEVLWAVANVVELFENEFYLLC